MASIESADFYHVVLTSMTEDGMSFDDAFKEFLERFERSLLNFDWIEENFHGKVEEFLKVCKCEPLRSIKTPKKNTKIDPKAFSSGLRTSCLLSRSRNEL